MQNKGALKLLVILLLIASAYQLSFTFVTRRVEKKAEMYASQFAPEEQNFKEQSYLDSLKSEVVYNLGLVKYTYKQVKDKEINLGLDLKGGMNVMLEISVEDVVKALSNDNQSPEFHQALAAAKEAQKNGDDFINSFANAYNEISGGAPLATLFDTPELRDRIMQNSSNEEVMRVLREETDGAIDNSFAVLRSRIDRFGVTQPNIRRIEGTGRILVELPGIKEPERVRKLLQGTASLEFWATYSNTDVYPYLVQANEVIRMAEEAKAEQVAAADSVGIEIDVTADSTAVEVGETAEGDDLIAAVQAANSENAGTQVAVEDGVADLFSKLSPMADQMYGVYPGAIVGRARTYDTVAVNAYLNMPQVKALFPRELRFLWGVKPTTVDMADNTKAEVVDLYAIRVNTRDGKAPLDGSSVVSASTDYDQRNASAYVSMSMNSEGARKWANMTRDNLGQAIAIVLDGYVYSAPTVKSEITGGQSQITGNFTMEEATDLANVLRSGKLPAPARIVQETVVGPSLGQESINASMISFLLAFVLVLIYMILFYNKAGWVASMALIINLILLFGVLASFGAVLTLPGIAGIVLTMGMAVDANVIIYERVKEELRAGAGLSVAIQKGYKHAMSAIIDANVTTIIVSIVLFVFGTGPVQGFATTLFIGIITSFFTAIFVTRLFFSGMLRKEKNIKFSNKYTENFLANTHVDFLKMRKITYIVTVVLIVLGVASLFLRGMNYGVEFTGGRTYVVRFDRDVTADEVRANIYAAFDNAPGSDAEKSAEVVQFGNADQMRIVTQYRVDDESEEASDAVETFLYQALRPLYTTDLTQEEFETTTTNPYGIISADKVGASIASETVRNAFIAVFFALFAIGVYVIIRFKKWQWGVGSVVALASDAFLTIALFSVFWGILPFTLEVNQAFIAAILTIIGYSINDKVVIFDRIREYRTLFPKRRPYENINNAINSTLSRTINTSGTTFVTLLAIFLFGGEVIRGFVFALLFGVFISTLSSIFVATPVAYDFLSKGEKDDNKKK